MFYSKSTGGFYDRSIHGDNIPSDAVEITTEEHAALLAGQSQGKRIVADADGRPMLADPPALTLIEQKAAALAAIDHEAGVARARYITIAPGQEATYLLKSAQAIAFKAGGYLGSVPGLVQAEIDATGTTAQAATDAILAQQAAWEYKAAQIESARRRGKVAAGNAVGAAGVEAAQVAAIAELGVL